MMLQKIEYAGIVCSVFPHKDIQTRTHLPGQDPEVVTYAAWRWLYHCRPLRKPLCVLCLGFRRNTLRRKSMRLVLTLPARAAGRGHEPGVYPGKHQCRDRKSPVDGVPGQLQPPPVVHGDRRQL